MSNNKGIVYGVGAVAALVSAFLVLDYVRRSDPTYKDKIKQRRKQSKAEAASKRNSQAQVAEQAMAQQAEQAELAAKQKLLTQELEQGQLALVQRDFEKAALHFANAVKASDSPMDIALFLKQNLEPQVFELMMKNLDPEVFRDKYFDKFPGEASGMVIKNVEQADKQRAVFALRDFAEGEEITSELPFASSLRPTVMDGSHCARCFCKVTGNPVPATTMAGESYCSETCRDAANEEYYGKFGDADAWAQIVALAAEQGRTEPFMVAKLLARVFSTRLADSTADIAHLHFVEPLPTMTPVMRQESELLKRVIKIESIEQLVNDESYTAMVGKVNTNEIPVVVDGQRVADAVYLIGSYFNHSCEPNMKLVFNAGNHKVSYVATKAIKKGDEIMRTYIDLEGKDATQRKAELQSRYKFTCDCPQCK
eukprot:comp19285_c0_seq1/m.22114 comp19285_c0_seq1/g.22114  ORF comp19285_c0_seq1/g.22114 comp19285_c0_seq1/m.22114 type:complete len:424 (-) comp19285_c0_seq1:645-1916(-)